MNLGGLQKLIEAVKQGYMPIDEITEVGRRFQAVPREEYFLKTPNPARSMDEATLQYGPEFEWNDTDLIARMPPRNPDEYPVEYEAMFNDARTSARDLTNLRLIGDDPLLPNILREYRPDQSVYSLDATGSSPNTGVGKKMYPAYYDVLGKDAINYSTGLTDINKTRRSFNMADSILRNPELSDRIIPSSSQLEDLGANALWYMGSATPEQRIGALLLGGSMKQLGRGMPLEGTATARKMGIIDQILSQERPSEFRHLGLKEGGLAQACKCQGRCAK